MHVLIRELRAGDDLTAVLSLCKAFFAEYEGHHEDFFDTDALRDDQLSGRFLDSITSETSCTLVATADGVIVGYASIRVSDQPDFYRIKHVGRVSGLMVDPAFRRRGIATQLLVEAKRWFREQGVKYFTVFAATTNEPALCFYQRCGLKPLHTTLIGEASSGGPGNTG